jgi:hypothetical protein
MGCRAGFIQEANYALVMFTRAHPGGRRYSQLHATSSALAARLNSPNYGALLGFAQGNLAEVSTYAPAQPRKAHQEPAGFRASFKFEPPPGDPPTFYMTAAVPELAVVCEAEPRQWHSASSMPGAARDALHPFLRASFSQVALDLATLASSRATYLGISAAAVSADDLRLAYAQLLAQLDIVRPPGQPRPGSAAAGGGSSFTVASVPELRTSGGGDAHPDRSPLPPPREGAPSSIGDALLQRHQSLGVGSSGKRRRAASLGLPARLSARHASDRKRRGDKGTSVASAPAAGPR